MGKFIKAFDYNRQAPCPTDKFVLPIYQEYKDYLNNTLEIWKKGVANQLLMHRDYIDIVDSRIHLVNNAQGTPTPIVSLRPVVNMDFEEVIQKYLGFFKLYMNLRNGIIGSVFRTIELKSDNPTTPTQFNIISSLIIEMSVRVNILKVLINAWNADKFDAEVFEVIYNEPRSQFAADAIRDLGLAGFVGPNMVNTDALLTCEVDDVLIGSFYKYVRKIML